MCVYKILSFYLFSFDQEVVYRHTNPQTNIYRVFFLAPRNFKIEYLRKSLTDFHFKKFFEKLRVCGIWWFFTKFRYDENKCVLNGTGKKYGFHNMWRMFLRVQIFKIWITPINFNHFPILNLIWRYEICCFQMFIHCSHGGTGWV